MYAAHVFLCAFVAFLAITTTANPVEKSTKESNIPHVRQKKSATVAAATFLAKYFAKYVLNKAFEAIEDYARGGSELDLIMNEFDKVEENFKILKNDINTVSSDVLYLITSKAHDSFAKDIQSLNLVLKENFEIMLKPDPTEGELLRREEVLGQILDGNRGIMNALRLLHLTVMGTTSYPKKSILEMYWNEIINGRDMKDFVADQKIRDQSMAFLTYLLELQQMGTNVWLTAITSKHSDESSRAYHHNITKGILADRLAGQEEHLGSTLFQACPAKSLSNYPGRGQALQCTDHSEFGSICKQRCAGSCRDQKKYWGDFFYYPSHGHPDIQCLAFGKWSTNVQGETKVGCTFCDKWEFPSLTKELTYTQLCYPNGRSDSSCSANTPINFALKKKVACQCNGKRRMVHMDSPYLPPEYLVVYFRYWCNVGRSWDYCLPSKISRNEETRHIGITIDGKKCAEECKLDKSGWYKCKAENGKREYCS